VTGVGPISHCRNHIRQVAASAFLKGPLHTLFCTETNIIPEITHEGAILIVDLPVKRFEQIGGVDVGTPDKFN
jgi:hypothetical protein